MENFAEQQEKMRSHFESMVAASNGYDEEDDFESDDEEN